MTPVVRNITRSGDLNIDFVPPVVAVPADWRKDWLLEEREKMAFAERIAFENELLDLLELRIQMNSDGER